MKLTITRLRSGTNYKTPLHDIMDSFYELYKEYISKNPQHTYGVCNFGWGAANRKKLDDIVDADVILIPSENEFFQHIKGYVDPRHKERSDEFIHQIGEHLANKHVILMRSDRADNEELYRTRTFKDQTIGKFSIFDEMDLPGGLHGMKYHFIKENMPMRLFESEREFDFIYWGCDKRKLIDNIESGDERHLVFKRIKKEGKLKSYFIGKYNSIVPDKKIDSMYNLLNDLTGAKSTLCFNWLDPAATTSRYHEAIACGILPFVWKNYDCNNTLVADQWQRVESVEELYEKMQDADKMFPAIEDYYVRNTMKPKSWYYENFENRMNEILNGV
jgi:hypothetical protein